MLMEVVLTDFSQAPFTKAPCLVPNDLTSFQSSQFSCMTGNIFRNQRNIFIITDTLYPSWPGQVQSVSNHC